METLDLQTDEIKQKAGFETPLMHVLITGLHGSCL